MLLLLLKLPLVALALRLLSAIVVKNCWGHLKGQSGKFPNHGTRKGLHFLKRKKEKSFVFGGGKGVRGLLDQLSNGVFVLLLQKEWARNHYNRS